MAQVPLDVAAGVIGVSHPAIRTRYASVDDYRTERQKLYPSGMLLVLRSAKTTSHRFLFTHIRAVLGSAVSLVASEVIDF